VQDVSDLMQCLIDVRAGVEQSVIDDVRAGVVIDDATDSGADVSMLAFEPQWDILNIHCDTY